MSLQSVKPAAFGKIAKFGNADTVGTTEVGIWPQNTAFNFPVTPRSVRIKAGGDAADTAAGAGARSIRVFGIDADFKIAEEDIVTAGASASAFTTTKFWRVWRATVLTSGTFDTANTGDIIVENETENLILSEIPATGGSSLQMNFTTPDNMQGEVTKITLFVSGPQNVTFRGYVRNNIDIVSAPFTAPRLIGIILDLSKDTPFLVDILDTPLIIPPKSDFWITGQTSSATSSTSVIATIQLKPTP